MSRLSKKQTLRFDKNTLRQLAGSRSYARGEAYAADNRVGAIIEDVGTLTAQVKGTRSYRVELWFDAGQLEYDCSCPLGDEGEFCKHCVAVGLTWLQEKPTKSAAKSERADSHVVTLDDVRTYLNTADKQVLIDLLLQHAKESDALRRGLMLKAAKQSAKKNNLDAYRRAIDQAVVTHDFVDYGSAYGYASQIRETVQSIDELLTAGHANDAIELTEYALTAVEHAMESVDDSGGMMGDILQELQELHHRACEQARPDPRMLARRLFEWEIRTDWDTFYGAAETYAAVLGDEGLAEYRTLAAAAWREVPQRKPGDSDTDRYGKHFRIKHIMEMLAEQSGDLESLVAIKAHTLSSAFDFLQIAETYLKAGKHDEALAWAERGIKSFSGKPESRLREFLANEYHRRKRHDKAMALAWAEFTDHASFEQYKALKAHAAHCKQWPSWRTQALEHLQLSIAKSSPPNLMGHTYSSSTLVQIYLWEKDNETAWTQAKTSGCSNDLWMQLARLREAAYPEDALAIYRKRIEPTIDRKSNDAYAEAVKLLRVIDKIMTRLNRKIEFSQYLSFIRATHKAKRNLIKLLDKTKFE